MLDAIKKYRFTRKGHYPSGYAEGEVVELPERCCIGCEWWVPVEGIVAEIKAMFPRKEEPKAPESRNLNISAIKIMNVGRRDEK